MSNHIATEACPICNEQSKHEEQDNHHTYRVTCSNCGSFLIEFYDIKYISDLIKSLSARQIKNISYYIKETKDFEISSTSIKTLLSIKTPPIKERYQKLLLAFEGECQHMGEEIPLSREKYNLISSAWSANYEEFLEFINFLKSENYISLHDFNKSLGEGYAIITFKGWSYIEEIKTANINSHIGFVAMWFKPKMTTIYEEAIAPAIRAAGYSPLRVDQHEHNNDITDEIIAQIRRSKFLVSDYTGHRGGVYFEAGFARGLGLEVFMTCRQDNMKYLHFDVRQRICIEWTEDNLPYLQKKLTDKIEATLGRGPILHDA
jgi:hypothetical protein